MVAQFLNVPWIAVTVSDHSFHPIAHQRLREDPTECVSFLNERNESLTNTLQVVATLLLWRSVLHTELLFLPLVILFQDVIALLLRGHWVALSFSFLKRFYFLFFKIAFLRFDVFIGEHICQVIACSELVPALNVDIKSLLVHLEHLQGFLFNLID